MKLREIEFRGKDVQGYWRYGYLLNTTAHSFICVPTSMMNTKNHNIEQIETIGQYTGLTDTKGKKIFEGDIIKYPDEVPYTVMFDPTGYWCLDGNGIRNSEMLIQNDDTNDYIEVIGNIYDNPELMEAKQYD